MSQAIEVVPLDDLLTNMVTSSPTLESEPSSDEFLPRLLIVEEALRNREGHWFEYNRATKAAVQGTSPTLVEMLGNQTMERDVADELDAIPYFRFTVWDQIYNYPQSWKRYLGILRHNYRLFGDLKNYFKTAEYKTTVFAPTVVLHHLMAYHAIAKRFSGKKFGQLILLIRNNIAKYDETGSRSFRGTARFWKWAIQRFRPMLKSGRVRFVTDSERLADEYEELTGIRFEVIPHPSLVGQSVEGSTELSKSDDRGLKSNPIQLFLPGPARYEKGVDRLLEAARELGNCENLPYLQFVLQWNQPFLMPNGASLGPDNVEQFESERVSFRTFREPLSSEEYRHLLMGTDFVILPYRAEVYYSRISGVAIEAMILGKPLLYTKNTWIETLARQFVVGVSMGSEPSLIAQTIRESISSREDLREVALAQQPKIAEFFSSENFRNRLLRYSADSPLEPRGRVEHFKKAPATLAGQ